METNALTFNQKRLPPFPAGRRGHRAIPPWDDIDLDDLSIGGVNVSVSPSITLTNLMNDANNTRLIRIDIDFDKANEILQMVPFYEEVFENLSDPQRLRSRDMSQITSRFEREFTEVAETFGQEPDREAIREQAREMAEHEYEEMATLNRWKRQLIRKMAMDILRELRQINENARMSSSAAGTMEEMSDTEMEQMAYQMAEQEFESLASRQRYMRG